MNTFFHSLHHAFQRRHGNHHPRHHHAGGRGPRGGFSGFGGFGGFGGFSGFGGSGGDGLRGDPWQPGPGGLHRGRKLGSADLQLLLLALLAERASHGYELIKALDDRSHGYYSPSPGMVYPALTYLEEVGYASVETQGTKKLYSVTVDGLAQLEAQRPAVDALLRQLAWIGSRMDELRKAMAGGSDATEADDEAADFDSPQAFRGRGRGHHGAGLPEVRAARRSLKSALIEKSGAGVAEQRRIATILERAAAAIRSGEIGVPGAADEVDKTGTGDKTGDKPGQNA